MNARVERIGGHRLTSPAEKKGARGKGEFLPLHSKKTRPRGQSNTESRKKTFRGGDYGAVIIRSGQRFPRFFPLDWAPEPLATTGGLPNRDFQNWGNEGNGKKAVWEALKRQKIKIGGARPQRCLERNKARKKKKGSITPNMISPTGKRQNYGQVMTSPKGCIRREENIRKEAHKGEFLASQKSRGKVSEGICPRKSRPDKNTLVPKTIQNISRPKND